MEPDVVGRLGERQWTGTAEVVALAIHDAESLKRQALFEDRDVYPALDLRGLSKGLLADHLGLERTALDSLVFPDSAAVRPLSGIA